MRWSEGEALGDDTLVVLGWPEALRMYGPCAQLVVQGWSEALGRYTLVVQGWSEALGRYALVDRLLEE